MPKPVIYPFIENRWRSEVAYSNFLFAFWLAGLKSIELYYIDIDIYIYTSVWLECASAYVLLKNT